MKKLIFILAILLVPALLMAGGFEQWEWDYALANPGTPQTQHIMVFGPHGQEVPGPTAAPPAYTRVPTGGPQPQLNYQGGYLYDGSGTYRGRVTCNPYVYDSIFNPYGYYGNPYNYESIWNPYGAGNPYLWSSPCFNQWNNSPNTFWHPRLP